MPIVPLNVPLSFLSSVIENIKPAKELNGTTNITMGPGTFAQGKNSVHTYTVNIYNIIS